MTRSQLILDVINKKNTSYLPSQCTFSSRSKKIEVAGYLGLTEDEVDVYLGNHIKFTAILDDIIQVDKLDPHRMKAARDAGRYLDVPGEDGMIYDLWGMKYNVNDGGYFNYCHPLQNCDEDDSLLDDYHAPDITDMDTLFSIAEEAFFNCLCSKTLFNVFPESTYEHLSPSSRTDQDRSGRYGYLSE